MALEVVVNSMCFRIFGGWIFLVASWMGFQLDLILKLTYTWDAGRTLQIQTELVKVNLLIS